MTEQIIPHDQSFIKYPCTFPIKIMGPTHDAFAETIVAVVKQHDPTFHIDKLEIRTTGKGNYTGLTANAYVTNRDQLDNLYRALSSHPMVKYVL